MNDRRLTNDRVGKQASIGTSIDYQGIPYYMKQMNEWVRTYAQKFNDIISSGYNAYKQQGPIMFTGKKATSNEQYTFDPTKRYDNQQPDSTVIVDATDDSYYKLTAGNFSVLAALIEDADLLATEKDVSDGKAQYDILTEIKVMSNDKTKMELQGKQGKRVFAVYPFRCGAERQQGRDFLQQLYRYCRHHRHPENIHLRRGRG